MDEKTFWLHLEFRLGPEFQGMADKRMRSYWCDGFVPKDYLLDGHPPRIAGRAWICSGQKQENWEFTLFFNRPYASRDGIDWSRLLPPPDTTCWIALDEARKIIQIDPSAAVPDLQIPD